MKFNERGMRYPSSAIGLESTEREAQGALLELRFTQRQHQSTQRRQVGEELSRLGCRYTD